MLDWLWKLWRLQLSVFCYIFRFLLTLPALHGCMTGCVCVCRTAKRHTAQKWGEGRKFGVFLESRWKKRNSQRGKKVTFNVMCESNLCVRDCGGRGRRHHWAAKSRMSLSPSHKRWTSALKLSLMSAKKPASEGETTFTQTRTCRCVYASLLWQCVCVCASVWICIVSPDRLCQTLLESAVFFCFFFKGLFFNANVPLTHIILAWISPTAPLSRLSGSTCKPARTSHLCFVLNKAVNLTQFLTPPECDPVIYLFFYLTILESCSPHL